MTTVKRLNQIFPIELVLHWLDNRSEYSTVVATIIANLMRWKYLLENRRPVTYVRWR